MGKEKREHAVSTLVKRAVRGKKTCNSCRKTKTVYPEVIDGVTYLYCDDCKD